MLKDASVVCPVLTRAPIFSVMADAVVMTVKKFAFQNISTLITSENLWINEFLVALTLI